VLPVRVLRTQINFYLHLCNMDVNYDNSVINDESKSFEEILRNKFPASAAWSQKEFTRFFKAEVGFSPIVLGLMWLMYGCQLIRSDVGKLEVLIVLSFLKTGSVMSSLAGRWSFSKSKINRIINTSLLVLSSIVGKVLFILHRDLCF
jgi:hypothetical protein